MRPPAFPWSAECLLLYTDDRRHFVGEPLSEGGFWPLVASSVRIRHFGIDRKSEVTAPGTGNAAILLHPGKPALYTGASAFPMKSRTSTSPTRHQGTDLAGVLYPLCGLDTSLSSTHTIGQTKIPN